MSGNSETESKNRQMPAAPDGAESAAHVRDYEARDVRDLIDGYPLAWVIGAGGGEAALLPLIGVFDQEDRLVELIGHFARSNPLRDVFAREPAATILFKGPDAYVSPADAGQRDWGPTWNYAQVRVQAHVTVEPDLTAAAVEQLVEHVERDRPAPWATPELGRRYLTLLRQIIGFRARVTGLEATFKLGQSETPDVFQSIVANLPDGDLVRWMRRFKPCSTC